MSLSRLLWVVFGNIRRNRSAFVMASVGLIIGVATGTFFVALGAGIQSEVLNRIYPVNQIEVEPKTVAVMGMKEQVLDPSRLDERMVEQFERLPDVTAVYPKLRSKLQARLWGGKSLFGYDARTEAFFDGLDPTLLQGELRENEGVARKRERAKLRQHAVCARDEECPLGQECGQDGRCGDIEYWSRFRYQGVVTPCKTDGNCPVGTQCVAGRCDVPCGGEAGACGQGEACVPAPQCEADDGSCPTACRSRCEDDRGCDDGQRCVARGDAKVCERLRCEIEAPGLQFAESQQQWRGEVVGVCANRVEWGSPVCERMACPGSSYCAPRSVVLTEGYCEQPIPVLLSPFLIEVFNSSVAESLGLQRLHGTDALLGVEFRMHFGDSYFTADLPREVQTVKRAEIVGFSSKALDFGVTMPIDYVRAINARYKGRTASEAFSTFILETEGNEDVSELIAAVEERGFTLGRKSEDAQKAADLLFILTAVFAFISIVIAAVAAVNIANTFLMIVAERRYEIGIMRAVGASRSDVAKIIVGEAVFLGVFGGIVGELVSYGLSRAVNALAVEHLEVAISKPDDFFIYDWTTLLGGIGIAVVFCILGAIAPARRAAKLDPAVVLTS